MTMHAFILGAGFSGKAIGQELAGRAASIVGTTRSAEKFDELRRAGIEPLLFDGGSLHADVAAALARTTHLFACAGPGPNGDPLLGVAPDLRAVMPALEWIGYLSTVGVYGDRQGAWVTEDDECKPRAGRSDNRLETERAWQEAADKAGVPLAIQRLSGIYGPGRNAFANLRAGTARRIVKPGQVFNRIHVDDIAGAALFLAERGLAGIWNVTDSEPAPPQDVVTFAARLMGVDPPPEVRFEEAAMTPMALSFWGEVKRVSNAKLRQAGYVFRRPDYRVALTHMWANQNW